MKYNQPISPLNVKSTMIDELLQIAAPHICCGCGKQGRALCNNCKNNITFDRISVCLLCLMPCKHNGLCNSCRAKVPYDKVWLVGERKDELEELINMYKFNRMRSVAKDLVDLLDATIPMLSTDTIIVPVPTIPSHIRRRGYDHTLQIAKGLAKRRSLKLQRLITRVSNTSQFGKSASDRRLQASMAFGIRGSVDASKTYLLIDDIFTTGSTIKYAAKQLKDSGAKDVWVGIIARQTLD